MIVVLTVRRKRGFAPFSFRQLRPQGREDEPNILAFENRTDMIVLSQVNNDDFEEVQAGSTVTFTVLTEDVDRFEITVITADGEVLFHEVLTEVELEEIGDHRRGAHLGEPSVPG